MHPDHAVLLDTVTHRFSCLFLVAVVQPPGRLSNRTHLRCIEERNGLETDRLDRIEAKNDITTAAEAAKWAEVVEIPTGQNFA